MTELESHNALELEIMRATESVLEPYTDSVLTSDVIDQIKVSIVNEAKLAIVGITEAAQILGISPQRVRQLVNEEKMPAPAATLAYGETRSKELWLAQDIDEFAAQRQPLRDAQRQLTHRRSKYEPK